MKSKSAAKKRFKKTGSGKIKRKKAGRAHILTKKSSDRKRKLRQPTTVKNVDKKRLQHMLNS